VALPPIQIVTGVIGVNTIGVGCVIITGVIAVHPLPSVTVEVYVVAHNTVAVVVV
jgi:hypothetical protein